MVDERSWRGYIRSVDILRGENIVDKCRWVIGLMVVYEYAWVCSLLAIRRNEYSLRDDCVQAIAHIGPCKVEVRR